MTGVKQLYLHTVMFFALVCTFSLGAVAAVAESPDKVAGEATKKVIQLLKDKRDVYKKNESVFYQDVEAIIDPVIAFDEIARGVMGKYAHRASDAEIKQFTDVFRSSLVHFYSKAILTFDTSQLTVGKIDPVPADQLKDYDSGKSRSVPVNLKIRSKDQEYSMSYSMMKKNGSWKIRNIIVEGINIGIQFRNQFGEAMNRYKKVDVVIAKWPELMKQTESEQVKELQGKEKK